MLFNKIQQFQFKMIGDECVNINIMYICIWCTIKQVNEWFRERIEVCI
jgi:hypothetical protein